MIHHNTKHQCVQRLCRSHHALSNINENQQPKRLVCYIACHDILWDDGTYNFSASLKSEIGQQRHVKNGVCVDIKKYCVMATLSSGSRVNFLSDDSPHDVKQVKIVPIN